MNKQNEWLDDIIMALNNLGGDAQYKDLYPAIRSIREAREAKKIRSLEAVVRRTIQQHCSETKSFKYHDVFFSVDGLGHGHWGVLPEYRTKTPAQVSHHNLKNEIKAYSLGVEGIEQERNYIKKSRDPRLVEARKSLDKYTCQACGYFREIGGKYVIDVHHINPLGNLNEVTITSIDDLICLCPNCHRIAHTNRELPLQLNEIKEAIKNG